MAGNVLKILFVEDSPEDHELATRNLERSGLVFEELRVESREDYLAAFETFVPDLIISDYSMPYFDGISALKLSLERDPIRPFIMLTGSMNEDTAVTCMRAGAMDYLIKSHASRLPFAVRDAMERSRLSREREAAAAALRESEQNYRTLADSGTALIWTSNREGLCTYFNKTWLDFTGRSLAEEYGNGWVEGVHAEDLEGCVGIYTSAFAKQEKFSMEYRLRRRDGTYRWIQDDGCPRYDARGDFLGYIGYCLDVSDRKQAEEAIALALEEKQILLREIFHRTRNNMQVIMSILSLEEGISNDPRVSEVVNKASDRIMSMSLIHQELYHSKDLSSVDLRDYTLRLLQMLKDRETFADGRIAINAELDPVSVLIDVAVPFGLILHELVSNSLRHAFPGDRQGQLRVRLARDNEGFIQLDVEDDGIGLPTTRAEGAKETLGFQLVNGLAVQQLNGTVDLDSRSGLSCRVRFADAQFIKRI